MLNRMCIVGHLSQDRRIRQKQIFSDHIQYFINIGSSSVVGPANLVRSNWSWTQWTCILHVSKQNLWPTIASLLLPQYWLIAHFQHGTVARRSTRSWTRWGAPCQRVHPFKRAFPWRATARTRAPSWATIVTCYNLLVLGQFNVVYLSNFLQRLWCHNVKCHTSLSVAN